MTITGQNLIAGEWSGDTKGGFKAFNAQTDLAIDIEFADATELEVNTAIVRANEAFTSYSQLSAAKRATFLRAIGAEILRIARASTRVEEFLVTSKAILNRMIKQGALVPKTRKVITKTVNRHAYSFNHLFSNTRDLIVSMF